jgi:hypothetical protein
VRRVIALAAAALCTVVLAAANPNRNDRPPTKTTSPVNSSLEIDADQNGLPDCWRRMQRGTNRGTFRLTDVARHGRHGGRIGITTFRSGSRALVVGFAAGCRLHVDAYHTYQMQVWYRGYGDLRLTADYLTLSGSWRHWLRGPRLSPATAGWIRASYATPPVPLDAIAVSFGLGLYSIGSVTTDDYSFAGLGEAPAASAPPPAAGYLTRIVPPGRTSQLPGDAACASRVHRSAWEPRPQNTLRNHALADPDAVHASFSARPRTGFDGYSPHWDSWLLPRVDGQFIGTTDEIIQWAACKWGVPDNLLRAEAYVESSWFQYEVYPTGRCVQLYGCGDWFGSERDAARRTYCDGVAALGGYDYQRNYGVAQCPKTFSIAGVMAWWNPQWGYQWPLNQAGMFPFTRDSTAMALDYFASQLRGCYEGWEWQLGSSYTARDLYGCIGVWYSGRWHDQAAQRYIAKIKDALQAQPWLSPQFAAKKLPCSIVNGCPIPG